MVYRGGTDEAGPPVTNGFRARSFDAATLLRGTQPGRPASQTHMIMLDAAFEHRPSRPGALAANISVKSQKGW